MKKIFFCTISILHIICATAQIKMASDEITDNLRSSQRALEPLSVEASINSYEGDLLIGFTSKNIVGETLYTKGGELDYGFIVDAKGKTVSFADILLPEGYYQITSIYLTRDNGGKELASDIFSYASKGYRMSLGQYDSAQNIEQLASALKERWLSNSMTQTELNAVIQNNKNNNEMTDFNDNRLRLKIIYCLKSSDSSRIYYSEIPRYKESLFLPVSYFEFLCKELKDKDVLMTYSGGTEGTGFHRANNETRIIKDVLTGNTVIQKDTLFHCIDIVVNDKLVPCGILQGENTGRVAVSIYKLVETNNEQDCLSYYTSISSDWTIWQESYNQRISGRLVRDRYFYVGYPGNGIPSSLIGPGYKRIIKVDDLNAIYSETQEYLVLSAEQKKQIAAKNYAWRAKRLYELCQKFGEEYGKLIIDYKISVGMTPEMCKEAWGNPIRILQGVNELGNYTAWIYLYNRYIYFVNDKVAEILY